MGTGFKRSVRTVLAGSLVLGGALTAVVIGGAVPVSAASVVQTISVPGAADVSSDGIHVWVTNRGGNTVTELNASTGSVIQTITVGNNPTGVSSDGTHVWVANFGDNTVTELNASTGSVVQTIGVGNSPAAVSSDGTHVWVANSASNDLEHFVNTVSELDASTGSVIRTINGFAPFPVAVSSDGTHVWVESIVGPTISELNASIGFGIQTITLGSAIVAAPVALSSDGTHVWVTNSGANTVTELNASTGSVVQTLTVGNGPNCVSSDGTHVWVAGNNTVTEISIVGFTITTSSLPSATPGVAYGPVTLQAANLGSSTSPYTTTLKWKKVTLPKGLKLSSAGVLSGTLNKKLAAGPSSATVQVTEKVTTLNGKKKVKTETTVQATIPLTIT